MLTFVFVLLVGNGVALRLLATQQQQEESHRLARRWSAAETSRLSQMAASQLRRAERVLRALASTPDLADATRAPRLRARSMAALLRGFESFAFVYAGLPDGSSYGAQRLLSGRLEVFTRRPGEPAELWSVEARGELSPKADTDPVPFDPRETRWYEAARQAEGSAWSRPYSGLGAANIVTASLAAGDPVFGVDVSLASISDAISEDAGPTERSSVFVLDRQAHPIRGLRWAAERGHEQALALFLRSGAGNIDKLDPETALVRDFQFGDEELIGAIRPLRLSAGAMGAVALLTPTKDVTLPVRLTLLRMLGLGLILGGTVAGFAAVVRFGLRPRRASGREEERRSDEPGSPQLSKTASSSRRCSRGSRGRPRRRKAIRSARIGSGFGRRLLRCGATMAKRLASSTRRPAPFETGATPSRRRGPPRGLVAPTPDREATRKRRNASFAPGARSKPSASPPSAGARSLGAERGEAAGRTRLARIAARWADNPP